MALEPHARPGLRIALIDPPDPSKYLLEIVNLHDDGVLDGAHVVVYRKHPARLSVELRLDPDDEDRVARPFRQVTWTVNSPSRFVIAQPTNSSPETVIPSILRSCSTRVKDGLLALGQPPIQFNHSQFLEGSTTAQYVRPSTSSPHQADSLRPITRSSDVSPEGGGKSAYLSVHQQQELRNTLGTLAQRVAWTVVADRHVDRDLDIGSLRIFTGSNRQRDIAAFARSTAAFRRPLRDVARQYNTFITDAELDDLLRELSELRESGLLSLRPTRTGRVNENRIKGLLATLIAARWYRRDGQPQTRLLISLDSRDALRWMHLSDDPLRADLVGFEWTNDHCTVTVIEVKSVEATTTEYKIEAGIVSGSAVDQMLATRRLLMAILAAPGNNELITTPARREILREHLYRELTKSVYSPEERKLWADRLRRLLDGKIMVEVGCHLIDVRLGVDISTLRDRNVIAKDGEESVRIRVRELNEELIVVPNALHPPAGDDGRGGPHPSGGIKVSKNTATPGGDESGTVNTDIAETLTGSETVPQTVGEQLRQMLESTTTHDTTPKAARPRALLGTAPGHYGKPREIWFDPNLPGQNLPNPHISITGESGSGKTQVTKAIISELRQQRLPTLILDFKDDYSSESFIDC